MRAAAYARYSTDKQTENSIAYQMEAITKYCLAHNIDLCAAFSDEAESGTNINREGFQSLIAAAKRHEFDAVVIYDISRGSRDVVDWFSFRKAMKAAGVKVISTTQELGDITDPSSFLTELITAGLGQHYVLDTRKKSMAGMLERAKKGLYCGGHAPLGYDIQEGRYIINPKEAETVRRIFKMYAAGDSYNLMVDKLKGVTGKFGRPFGKNSFNSILSNERYVGKYKWNERNIRVMRKWAGGKKTDNPVILEGVIPPIIDRITWEKVQKRMNSGRKAVNKAKREYLLSGLIECAECGAAYVGHCSTNRRMDGTVRENRYYECGNRYRTHTCKNKNINADELETFVIAQIKDALNTWDFSEIAQELEEKINKGTADCTKEKKELVEIEKQIYNGVKAITSGISLTELTQEIDRLRQRKLDLETIITAKNSSMTQKCSAKEIEESLKLLSQNFDSKTAVRTLVQKIYANTDGSCTVHIGVHIHGAGGTEYTICTVTIPCLVLHKKARLD